MQEKTKKYIKDTLKKLDCAINTLESVFLDELKDIRKAQRNLRKFSEKVLYK